MIDAHAFAVAIELTVYDAMYLALTVRLKTELVTANDRLGRTVAARPMTAAHVRLNPDVRTTLVRRFVGV